MSYLVGRFYLKLTASENLVGEYSNNVSERVTTEAANRDWDADAKLGQRSSRFIGDYHTIWLEGTNVRVSAKLKIRPKDGYPGIFTVKWSEGADFVGEAMLCDGILMGDYMDGPTDAHLRSM